jgi:hypothetical protein
MRRQLLGKSHQRHIPYIANQLNGTFTNSAEGTLTRQATSLSAQREQ